MSKESILPEFKLTYQAQIPASGEELNLQRDSLSALSVVSSLGTKELIVKSPDADHTQVIASKPGLFRRWSDFDVKRGENFERSLSGNHIKVCGVPLNFSEKEDGKKFISSDALMDRAARRLAATIMTAQDYLKHVTEHHVSPDEVFRAYGDADEDLLIYQATIPLPKEFDTAVARLKDTKQDLGEERGFKIGDRASEEMIVRKVHATLSSFDIGYEPDLWQVQGDSNAAQFLKQYPSKNEDEYTDFVAKSLALYCLSEKAALDEIVRHSLSEGEVDYIKKASGKIVYERPVADACEMS